MKNLLRIRIITTLTLSLITIFILLYFTINFSYINNLQDLSVNISNRTTPPAGAQLLQNGTGITNGAPMRDGNFQVEGYCDTIGGQVSENGVDWFCGGRILTPEDFDEICKMTYNTEEAIAIKNGTGSREAYKWRCYSLPQNTPTSTPSFEVTTTNEPTEYPSEGGGYVPKETLYPPCGPIDCNQDKRIDIIDFSCFAEKYNKMCYVLF